MSGSFSTIQIGRQSIFTHSKSIEVTAHNIANVNTEGYSRQRAVIEANKPVMVTTFNTPKIINQVGTGVFVSYLENFRDQFIDAKITKETSTYEWKSTADTLLKQIETIINEPGSSTLRDQLDAYWAAWQDLSTDASNTSLRMNLVEETNNLITKFQEMDTQLKRLTGYACWSSQGSIDNQVDEVVKEINNLASLIGNLNEQIARAESTVERANDLRDQRQKALEELAELIKIEVYYDKKDHLLIDVGHHQLVNHKEVNELFVVKRDENTPRTIAIKGEYPDLSDNTEVADAALLHTIDHRNYTITVTQLAQNQELQSIHTFNDPSKMISEIGVTSGSFYLNGREFFIDADQTSISDLVTMLDKSSLNVNAQIDEFGQLTLSATQTGTQYSIITTDGTSNLFGILNLREEQEAQNAMFSVNGQKFVSSKNMVEDALEGVKLELKGLGIANLDLRPIVNGGKLKGLLEVRDGILDDVIKELNQMAYSVIQETNQLHRSGYGLDGVTNRNFFAPLVSEDPSDPYKNVIQNMALEEHIKIDLRTIAAASGSFTKPTDRLKTYNGDGDGSIAIMIAQLKHQNLFNYGKSSFNDFYNEMVTRVALKSQKYEKEASYSKDLIVQLEAKRQEISGVSLDEELSNLIRFQHGYNAAAKIINVSDEMLDTIIGLKR